MTKEEAIKLLSQIMDTLLVSNSWLPSTDNPIKEAFGMAIDALNTLPSAEPKKGKWIIATGMMPPEFHGHHCCSKCGNFANMEPPFGNREDLSNFCPYCGADMRGETK